MSPEKQKLKAVMDRIKAILQEEDVAAVVVLTVPDDADNEKSHACRFMHIETSFSCAENLKAGDNATELLIELPSVWTVGTGAVNKLFKTSTMLMSLSNSCQQLSHACEASLKGLKTILSKKLKDGETKPSMN